MAGLPSYSFFGDLNEECSIDLITSIDNLAVNSLYDYSCVDNSRNLCDLPNISLDDSLNLQNDTNLFNDISNLSDNSNFSFESPSVNSLFDKEIGFCDYKINFDTCEESFLPSSFIENTNSSLDSSLESPYINDILNQSDSKEILQSGSSNNYSNVEGQEANLVSLSLVEKKATNKLPVTLVLKRIKSHRDQNMVAPLDVPRTLYSVVRIPGKNELPGKVVVTSLQKDLPYKNGESLDAKSKIKNLKQNKIINDENLITKQSEEFSYSNEVQKIDVQDLPFTSLKRKCLNNSKLNNKPIKKKKAYELEPLPDPALERCRRNAINAKKNRDNRKEKLMKLEAEVEKVMKEKLNLARENETLKQKNEELEKKVNCLKSFLTDNQFTLANHSRSILKRERNVKELLGK